MTESDFIAALRTLPLHPGARDLSDDAAVFAAGGGMLVATHDTMVEGVHYLAGDPPQSVAWRLVAVNLSDLAAKGATPVGILLSYTLARDDAWDRAFIDGLRSALVNLDVSLLGGDTVAIHHGPRTHGVTALGRVTEGIVPARSGAQAGDQLWVTGSIGDAGIGLRIRKGELQGPDALVARYHYPASRLDVGRGVARYVSAMTDVSDGLLIDASRMAEASGLALRIDLDAIPLSVALLEAQPDTGTTRIAAATAGDDYELLFSAPASATPAIETIAARCALPVTRIGSFADGTGITLTNRDGPVPLPDRLGYLHGV